MKDSHLKIVPYDDEYPRIFSEIKEFIHSIIPFEIRIEHIGSTAVPGLGGRRIIDILIITEREYMQKVVELLEARGFKYNPQASTLPEKLFVSGPYRYKGEKLHVHIHVTFQGSREHEEKLLFRDYLRRNPTEAKRYYEFKKLWMEKAGSNLSKYREYKAAYIKVILEKAKEEIPQ